MNGVISSAYDKYNNGVSKAKTRGVCGKEFLMIIGCEEISE